mmetsp:Transcript_98396/g.278257  ORF Transcript_98396/g.278257 Transcript_98396/m.278257 type:complete len:215 (-) Transcript_98396:761-1405(-)
MPPHACSGWPAALSPDGLGVKFCRRPKLRRAFHARSRKFRKNTTATTPVCWIIAELALFATASPLSSRSLHGCAPLPPLASECAASRTESRARVVMTPRPLEVTATCSSMAGWTWAWDLRSSSRSRCIWRSSSRSRPICICCMTEHGCWAALIQRSRPTRARSRRGSFRSWSEACSGTLDVSTPGRRRASSNELSKSAKASLTGCSIWRSATPS